MSRNGRPPSDNEDNLSLWRRFTQGIKPLKQPPRPDDILISKQKSSPPPHKKTAINHNITPKTAPATTKQKPQLDGRRRDKLKKGKIPVEGVIDLHDMTQAQAHQALTSFLINAHNTGKRCVLVITGKGTRSESGIGVLKSRLPDWISIAPLSTIVIDHVPAHRKHGGTGAFYIYLRKIEKI